MNSQRDTKKAQSKKSALSCRFQEASVLTKHTQKHTQKKEEEEKDASLPQRDKKEALKRKEKKKTLR